MTKPDKDLDWLREQVIDLFANASRMTDAEGRAVQPDHTVCVKYIAALMELLPGPAKTAGTLRNSHPDASLIEQVRLAIQQTTHPVPKSQTEP